MRVVIKQQTKGTMSKSMKYSGCFVSSLNQTDNVRDIMKLKQEQMRIQEQR